MKPQPRKMSAAKVAFETMLDDAEKWFTWIAGAAHFESLMKDKIPWDMLKQDERESVQRRIKTTTPTTQLMVNSFYITMVAGFEEYLRGVIRELAFNVTQTLPEFEKIDSTLRKLNIRESARLLIMMDSPPDYIKLDEVELCRELGKWVPGSKGYALNGIALSEVSGLVKLDNFFERVKILGRKIDKDSLGSQQTIKDALHLSKGKTREVATELMDTLKTISQYRNRIAHTGGYAADVTIELAKEHRIVMSAVAAAIDEAVYA